MSKTEILWQRNTMIMKVHLYFQIRKRLSIRTMMIAITKRLVTYWKGLVILKEGVLSQAIIKKFLWITKHLIEKVILVRIWYQKTSWSKKWMFTRIFSIMNMITSNLWNWNLKILILDSNKNLNKMLFYLILIKTKFSIKRNMRIWAWMILNFLIKEYPLCHSSQREVTKWRNRLQKSHKIEISYLQSVRLKLISI